MKQENIFGLLGIRINNLSQAELLDKLDYFLDERSYHWLATINAEIIVHSYNDLQYAEILNKSDINVIDGSGPQYIAWLKNFGQKIYRHPGVDLVDSILEKAYAKNLKILFFGGQEITNNISTTEKSAEIFRKKYKDINISIEQGGKVKVKNKKIIFEKGVLERIKSIKPDVILVALSNPIQEKFVYFLQNYLDTPRLVVGVGGSFNMISGYLKRAPKTFRKLGLEWLWRLIIEPRRIGRIIRAVIIFPSLVIFRKIFPKRRPNVVACVVNNDNKILLCERKKESNHWQFPQGGIDNGFDEQQTVLKELQEEVGITEKQITKLYRCEQTYKYLWTKDYLNQNFYNSYKGQKQSIWLARFSGNDDDVVIDNCEFMNYKWVDAEDVEKDLFHTRLGVWEIIKKNLGNL